MIYRSLLLSLTSLCALASSAKADQNGLQVAYGSGGIQQLTYNGVVLEDVGAHPSDAFHIWHMQFVDSSGNPAGGWGESNNGRSWDPQTHTWTYQFSWGTISLQYVQSGNTLNMNVTEVNQSNSGVTLNGATLYPLALHFPQLPPGFVPNVHKIEYNYNGPSVTLANYGSGEVAMVDPDATKWLYNGFEPTGDGDISYTAVVSSTAMDSTATFEPHFSRPVLPGHMDQFTVSLRFGAAGTPTSVLAEDVYRHWVKAWPPQLSWTDRRAIATEFLASSPANGNGNTNPAGGYANNPRRYFNDSNPGDFDIRTTAGLAQFQAKIIGQAQASVQNALQMNAQGLITWDIEGEQYPMNTSYACAPDMVATLAPEMETVVSSGTYAGMKLDDAYFSIVRNAGLRVGVCIRPQHFTLNADGTASQVFLPDWQVEAEMVRKMRFAHSRWGATLFYVDSDVDQNGANFNAVIFQQLAGALPDSLIIPEQSTPKYYAYTAPFLSFLFHGDLATRSEIYNYYPNAFSANLVNDVSAGALAQYEPQLTQAVKNGDLLMGLANWWQPNDPTIVQIYQAAGH